MAYGHAERNLAVIRQLEAETSRFLASLDESFCLSEEDGGHPRATVGGGHVDLLHLVAGDHDEPGDGPVR
jgi:hypothetical protein